MKIKFYSINSKMILRLLLTIVFLTSCSEDISNSITIEAEKLLFTSNNSDGNVNVYNVITLDGVAKATLTTPISAADGIYYDANNDVVIQASRSTNGLEGYTGISATAAGISTTVSVNIVGTTDMSNPREVAVNGDFFVVADSDDVDGNTATADGRLFVYQRIGSAFTLRNTVTINFKVWGIIFVGNDLWAIEDADNKLAVFNNFLSNNTDATVAASKSITIEGIVRTHGLTYDSITDTMILTDIGLASNTQDDGGFHIINNFNSKFSATTNGGTLAVSEQIRVSGPNTLMGNPVDVAYDSETMTVFIAEAGNGGGRILAFNTIGSGGNLTPAYNSSLASASAVYLHKK